MKRILLIVMLLAGTVLAQNIKPMLGTQLDWSDPINKGLLALYAVNSSAGSLLMDSSGNSKNGTLSLVSWVLSPRGAALDFSSSTSALVDLGYPVVGSSLSGLSVVCLCKVAGTTPASQIIAENGTNYNYNTFYLSQEDASHFGFTVYGPTPAAAAYSSRVSSVAYSVGDWYHVVGTWTPGKDPDFYLNGVLSNGAAGGTARTGLLDGNRTLQLGKRPDGTSTSFTGQIAFFAVYSRTLTPSEILRLYQDPWCGFVKERPELYVAQEAGGSSVPAIRHLREQMQAVVCPIFVIVLMSAVLKRRKSCDTLQ